LSEHSDRGEKRRAGRKNGRLNHALVNGRSRA
jgi:hypothetical protein